MPAASEAVGAPGGGGGDGDVEQEYEIRNDEGFVYKVARGLYPDAAPSSSSQPAVGPDPKAAGLRRRRRALLRLRDKRLRDLARWEALASELLAPLPAPQPPASPPAASQPDAAAAATSSSSASIIDELLAQADTQTEWMKRARQWCDEANALCDAREAAIFDSIVPPLWGSNPKELMVGLCSPGEKTAIFDSIGPLLWGGNPMELGNPKELTAGLCSPGEKTAIFDSIGPPLWGGNSKELMAGLCSPGEKTASGNLDEQNGRQEAFGVSSAAAEMKKSSIKKQKMGHDLPPILTESRKRKRVINLSGSNNVALQASAQPKRKKASGSASTAAGTPGSETRRKAGSIPARVQDIVCSPGPLTRRRAAAENESPGAS